MKGEEQIKAETFSEGEPIKCKWLRVRDVLANYPLRMTSLYKLIGERKIKSFVLRDRGAIRGIRLIDRDSLDLFFEMEARRAEEALRRAEEEDKNPPTP